MQSTDLDRIASIICSVDLDTEDLGWANGAFFPIHANSMGHMWRAFQRTICVSSPDSEFDMVIGKVRSFLDRYEGGLFESEVSAQLSKLEAKLQAGLNGKHKEKVTRASNSISNGMKPASRASSRVEVHRETKVTKSNINFEELFCEYHVMTKDIENEYKPYLPYTKQSCRCSWIFCPSKTNVKLTNFSEEENGYIHANTVSLGKGLAFIATIYPYQRTMFWSMALEHGNSILDVTNENDLDRNNVTPYYPQKEGEKYRYSKRMEVTCLKKEEVTPTLIKYQLKVADLDKGQTAVVDRFHYIGWEDVCGTNEVELLEVVKYLEPYLNKDKVPLVHCMGGVGRTGTALTAFALKVLIDNGVIVDETDLLKHIQNIILEGRKQRGPEYVQTPTQIETLYKFCLLALKHKNDLSNTSSGRFNL